MTDSPEARVQACYGTWAETYFRDYYGDASAYPPVHRSIIRDVLRASGARTVLDAGCGPASILRAVAEDGFDVYGFDLTPEMVAEAERVLVALDVPAGRVWQGSVLDAGSYRCPTDGAATFDAALCLGVLPHVPVEADGRVAAHLAAALKPGGTVAVEARNQFFSLFTQNRYTYDFLANELIRADELRSRQGGGAVDAALAELRQHLRMDLPPVRTGHQGEPGYDEVLSRTHNPLRLKQIYEAAGFAEVRLLFYHYHCLPPMLAHHAPAFFHGESVAMEDPEDWRGLFMASAFILTGRRR